MIARFVPSFAAFVTAALCAASPAHAMNRCTDAQGNTTFSDRPCVGAAQASVYEPRPASGFAGASAERPGAVRGPTGQDSRMGGRPAGARTSTDVKLALLDRQIEGTERAMTRDGLNYGKWIARAQDEFLRLSGEGHHDRAAEAQGRMKSLEVDLSRRLRSQRERLSTLKVERESLERSK